MICEDYQMCNVLHAASLQSGVVIILTEYIAADWKEAAVLGEYTGS